MVVIRPGMQLATSSSGAGSVSGAKVSTSSNDVPKNQPTNNNNPSNPSNPSNDSPPPSPTTDSNASKSIGNLISGGLKANPQSPSPSSPVYPGGITSPGSSNTSGSQPGSNQSGNVVVQDGGGTVQIGDNNTGGARESAMIAGGDAVVGNQNGGATPGQIVPLSSNTGVTNDGATNTGVTNDGATNTGVTNDGATNFGSSLVANIMKSLGL